MNAIRQELEREQAKLERRRHKSGELRELRKKQKEQEEMANLVDREKQIQIEDAQNETSHSIPNGVEEAVSDNIPLGEPSLKSAKEQEPEHQTNMLLDSNQHTQTIPSTTSPACSIKR